MAKKKPEPKKIKVNIRATQQVRFNQVVEMTRAEFGELSGRMEKDEHFGRQNYDDDLGGWLDLRDCDTDGDLEDIEINEVKK